MKAIKFKTFSGKMIIDVAQFDGENKTGFRCVAFGDSLNINKLAGTITAAVFEMDNDRRAGGYKDVKKNKAVEIRIMDAEGGLIVDSNQLDIQWRAQLSLSSRDKFGINLHNGLKFMLKRHTVTELSSVISDKAFAKLSGGDMEIGVQDEVLDFIPADVVATSAPVVTPKKSKSKELKANVDKAKKDKTTKKVKSLADIKEIVGNN